MKEKCLVTMTISTELELDVPENISELNSGEKHAAFNLQMDHICEQLNLPFNGDDEVTYVESKKTGKIYFDD